MTKALDIHVAHDAEEREEILRIREAVFIEGQGVPRELEMDGLDDGAEQVIVLLSGRAVACARLRFLEGKAKLERIAVLPECRGQGIGAAIIAFLLDRARAGGAHVAVMHAQCASEGFYRTCGFEPRGEAFLEAGIRHVEMVQGLPAEDGLPSSRTANRRA